MIVVDTNVVSELMRPDRDGTVTAWVLGRPRGELHLTALTMAEILYGIERLPAGRRKVGLAAAAADVVAAFPGRVLPFDEVAAGEYASVVDGRDRAGRPIATVDAQIAAICRARGASLATRNVRDFADTGLVVVDPWDIDA